MAGVEGTGGLAAVSIGFSTEFILLAVAAVVLLFVGWKLAQFVFALFD